MQIFSKERLHAPLGPHPPFPQYGPISVGEMLSELEIDPPVERL